MWESSFAAIIVQAPIKIKQQWLNVTEPFPLTTTLPQGLPRPTRKWKWYCGWVAHTRCKRVEVTSSIPCIGCFFRKKDQISRGIDWLTYHQEVGGTEGSGRYIRSTTKERTKETHLYVMTHWISGNEINLLCITYYKLTLPELWKFLLLGFFYC